MADITTKMPTPPPRQTPVLHPAAQEAAAAYSEALTNASRMESELRELRITYEAASRHIGLLEKELAETRTTLRAAERYIVETNTHFGTITTAITIAQQKALAFAKQRPEPEMPRAVVEDMERAIAEAAIESRKDP